MDQKKNSVMAQWDAIHNLDVRIVSLLLSGIAMNFFFWKVVYFNKSRIQNLMAFNKLRGTGPVSRFMSMHLETHWSTLLPGL